MVEGGTAAGDKRLLVLGAGPSQLGLLEAAHTRGLYVVAVDGDHVQPALVRGLEQAELPRPRP